MEFYGLGGGNEAGKIVVCEKPMAMNMDEAQEMVDAVEKARNEKKMITNKNRCPGFIWPNV